MADIAELDLEEVKRIFRHRDEESKPQAGYLNGHWLYADEYSAYAEEFLDRMSKLIAAKTE